MANHTSNSSIPGGFVGVDIRGDVDAVLSITGNTGITSVRQPIDIITGDSVGDVADVHLTILNNSVTATGNVTFPNNEGIFVEMTRATTNCLNIQGNTATGSGNREGIELLEDVVAPGNARIEAPAAGFTDVETYLESANTATAFVDEFNLGVSRVDPGTCDTP